MPRLMECVESDAEVTEDRLCVSCGHAYTEGDESLSNVAIRHRELTKAAAQMAQTTLSFSRLGLRFLETTSLYFEHVIKLELEDQISRKTK